MTPFSEIIFSVLYLSYFSMLNPDCWRQLQLLPVHTKAIKWAILIERFHSEAGSQNWFHSSLHSYAIRRKASLWDEQRSKWQSARVENILTALFWKASSPQEDRNACNCHYPLFFPSLDTGKARLMMSLKVTSWYFVPQPLQRFLFLPHCHCTQRCRPETPH